MSFNGYSLYQIAFPRRKHYFGIARRPGRRWREHLRAAVLGSEHPVHRAMRKYPGRFEFKVLCIGTRDFICDLEILMITKFGGRRRGYNVMPGGDLGATGLRHAPDTKAAMSAARKGRKQSRQHIQNLSAARRGQKRTVEQRARMSAGQKRRVRTPAELARMGQIARMRKTTPEWRAKLRTAALAREARKRQPEPVLPMSF